METKFNNYHEINCRTKLRVTDCIGYRTSLCEGRCDYAKVFDKFHDAVSGLDRFNKKYPNYDLYRNKLLEQRIVENAGMSMECVA